MNAIASFWYELLPPKGDGTKPAAKRHEYCLKVLEILGSWHPEILAGQPRASLSERQTQHLLNTLQKNTPGHILKHRVSYLIRGLEYGSLHLEWDVAIPDPPVVIPREKPRLTHESFTDLPFVLTIERAFLDSLKLPPPPNLTTHLGQLLLSAILFGGLVNRKWLTAYLEALPTAISESNLLWLDLVFTADHGEYLRRSEGKNIKSSRYHSGTKDIWSIKRRWFADPLTHALILRWHRLFSENFDSKRTTSPMIAIRNYIDHLGIFNKKFTDHDAKRLLYGCSTRLGLQVSPFLQAYAEGKIKSVSLPEHVWLRLLSGGCVRRTEQQHVEPEMLIPIDAPLSLPKVTTPSSMARQEELLKIALDSILPSGAKYKKSYTAARADLQTYHDRYKAEMCTALHCLVLWGLDLLTAYNRHELTRGRVKSALKAITARSYLGSIGKRLIAVAGTESIADLEGDELHDLYSEVIASCPTTKSRNWTGERLYAFHQFLMIRLGAQPVDFSDLTISAGPAELAVSGNLVSPDSFDLAKKVLCPDYSAATRLRKVQLLTAIIAFRCGLRRMEVLKLRLTDLLGNTEPELLVRNNHYGYVKSNESIRRIPLHCLLEDNELAMLLEWRKKRELEDGARDLNSLLFCREGQPKERLEAHLVIVPVMQAIHQVTGDTSLVFHHLRHSFATWLLLRLLPSVPDAARKKYSFLRHRIFEPDKCAMLRSVLLPNHQLGRQALYATAQLCGHISPEVTLFHYFHLCDLLLQMELSVPENQPILDAATVMAVTGMPQHTTYYAKKVSKSADWQMSFALDRLDVPERLKAQFCIHKPSIIPLAVTRETQPDNELPKWVRVFAVVRERQIGRIPFNVLAVRSGFSEPEIRFWISNVERLSAMKTGKGALRHINSATSKNKAFHFPKQVRIKEDKAIAEAILARFESSTGRIKAQITEGVRYFIHHFTASKAGIRFQTIRDVKRYLAFLSLLQIPAQQIRIIRLQSINSKLSAITERLQLSIKCSLPESSIVIQKPDQSATYRNGFFMLQVTDLYSGKSSAEASYGFRFAMYMIAVMSGLGDEMISTPRTQAA